VCSANRKPNVHVSLHGKKCGRSRLLLPSKRRGAARSLLFLGGRRATRSLTWSVSYNSLSGPATMAHFHGPATEGKNGPPVIWLKEKGVAVESPIKGEATLTPEQAQQLMAGEWYINVHTQANPSGEIRGQVMPPKG
jgi:CHRD domain